MGLTIGVDIGGTKVAGGVVDEKGQVLARERRATPARSAPATQAAIVDVIRTLQKSHAVDAVGIGAAGFVDEKRATIVTAPNVAGWRNEPLKERLEAELDVPVVVENDANAATWAEAKFGAGRGEDFIVCATVGTGIGGGILLGGEIIRGRFGFGGEIGHIQMVPGGRRCGCGNRGCWEQYASGSALVREARERAAEDREDAEILLGLGDGTPEGITGKELTQAGQAGDPVARESFDEVGRWLGRGLADLAAVLDPGCFVIGGGVSEAGELLLAPARKSFAESVTGRGARTLAEIRQAELGNEAGIVGAADLARYL